MSEQFKNNEIDENIDDISVAWFLRVEAGMNEDEKASFQEWLEKSSKHEESFYKTCELFEKVDTLDKIKLEALREPEKQKSANNITFTKLAIIACSLFILIGVGFLSKDFFVTDKIIFQKTYLTTFLEKKELELQDGTKIVLDSNTNIEVKYYENNRNIYLSKGRVFFDVAPNKLRPFNIYTGINRVKVLGTSFVVEHENDITNVEVKSGKVQVARLENKNSNKIATGSKLYLKYLLPGDKVMLSDIDKSSKFSHINPRQVGQWKDGRVEFDNVPLELALKEFARYSKTSPILGDESLRSLPIMGSFDLNRSDAFVQSLEMLYDIKSVQKEGKEVLVKNK